MASTSHKKDDGDLTVDSSVGSHPLAIDDSVSDRAGNQSSKREGQTLNRETASSSSIATSQPRPNYFDLQRLAAAAAPQPTIEGGPSIDRGRLGREGKERDRSDSVSHIALSYSAASSSISTSSQASDDDVEEMGDEHDAEDDGIPRWINAANSTISNRRPPSRNSVFSTVPPKSNRESMYSYPHRSIGVSSRNSMRSPPPGGSSSFGTMVPPSRIGTPHNDLDVARKEDGERNSLSGVEGKETSRQFLVSLHLMTDEELDRHLGMSLSPSLRPNASPLQTQVASMSDRSDLTASRSKFGGLLSTSPRSDSPQANRSASSLAVMESSRDMGDDMRQSRQRHKIVRELSLRLESLARESERSRRTLEQEKDRLMYALSASKKESQAREEALKEILLTMGVSTARVERALVQATSQAQVPVFRADERVAGSFSSASKAKETEQLLPESLREAMLEDIDGSADDSHRASSIDLRSNSLKTQDGGRNASPSSSRAGVSSDMSTPSGRASRSAWGSGLVSWSRTGPTNKKASASIQATSPAAVEADGYFSDTPGRDTRGTPSPSPQRRPSHISRSSSISAVMSQLKAESEDEDDEEGGEREGRSGWADTASRGALGLLGSLAWRRKKPDRNRTIRRREGQVRSPPALVEPDSKDSVAQRDKDSASIRSNQTRRSSVSSRKQVAADEERREETIRAKLSLARPQAQYTMSGRDVISALYEAIGSAPVSPETEKKQPFLATADLPKPAHFKAICLATRIMTPDAGSILSNGGKEASTLVKKSGLALVKGARDEGKFVVENSGSGANKGGRKSSVVVPPIPREKSVAEDRDARAAPPSKPANTGATSTTATLSKALGKYSKQTQKVTEPNVTRLPHLFGLGSAASATTSASRPVAEAAAKAESAAREKPLVTELEPIFAHDVKPPTLALSARRSIFIPPPAPQRKRRDTQDSLGRVSEGEESSGDEFEVYGGKHLQAHDKGVHRSRESGVDDTLLTDRYGFVYDATPADVRLLRRARKEATHAPACLTGIRVGVRARGGTDSQSDDDKDDADLVGADSESDIEDKGEGSVEIPVEGAANGHDSDNASQRTVSSHKTAGTGGAAGSSAMGLLSVKPGKPVAQASTLSAASQSSSGPGPTCPAQERLQFEGQGGQTVQTPAAPTAGSQRRPPSTSQTVKRLLGQLEEMHNDKQTTQQTEWDDFLKRRRSNNRDGKMDTSHDTASKSSSSAFSRFETSALSEEEWHLGGIVGLNRMGTESKDYQDFVRLLYKGIPLVYRPKIWYECSGAMELNEPGKYQELLKDHENEENQCTNQIDLDIGRTMPTNVFFSGDGPGVPKLRRLLVAFSWFNPKCGYCQGMNNLAATLLLTHATEEDAFWVLVSIIEKILPEEYYTSHLLVSQADQRVLMDLMDDLLPELAEHIRELGVDLPAVTFAWFLSLYTDCLPVETLFRVWDVMFVEGMIVLFRVAMAIFTIHEKELLQTSSPSAFYSFVHGMTSHLFSVDRLIKLACEDLKPTVRREMIIERREKHAKDLTIELGLDQNTPAP